MARDFYRYLGHAIPWMCAWAPQIIFSSYRFKTSRELIEGYQIGALDTCGIDETEFSEG